MSAAVLIAAGVWAVYGRVPLSYDSYFALLWGRDIAHGRSPQYDLRCPAPHPLFTAIGTVLSPLGHGAEAGLRVVVLLALGAACVAVFHIGRELAGAAAGLLAGAILLTRAPVLEFANRASVDVLALALLAWAAALELRHARRGAPVLALLALAGLLRPEAWLLSAAYWLWLARSLDRSARVRLAVLAAAAPALWIGTDLLVTGDALWSSHQTAVKVRDAGDLTGFDALARVPRQVGSMLRVPELLAAAAGVALAIALRIRRAALPLALLALSAAGALVLALDDQTILQRFFFFPAALLAAFAGLAVLGWLALEPGEPVRRRWRAGGLALGRVAGRRAARRRADRRQPDRPPRGRAAPEPAQGTGRVDPGEAGAALLPAGLHAGGRDDPDGRAVRRHEPSAFAAGPRPSPTGALIVTAPGVVSKDLPIRFPHRRRPRRPVARRGATRPGSFYGAAGADARRRRNPASTSARIRSCRTRLALATIDIWKSAPEPRSGRSSSERPRASVTIAPASVAHSTAAARS